MTEAKEIIKTYSQVNFNVCYGGTMPLSLHWSSPVAYISLFPPPVMSRRAILSISCGFP